MEFLGSAELLRFDGTKVKAKDALADKKVVAFYFSAHWCPPCRAFTPVLKKFYEVSQKISVLFIKNSTKDKIDK
jgi:nucleoredoxin